MPFIRMRKSPYVIDYFYYELEAWWMCISRVPLPGLWGSGQNPRSPGCKRALYKVVVNTSALSVRPEWSLRVIATFQLYISLRLLYVQMGAGFWLYWDDYVFFALYSTHIVYHINFHILDQLCIPGINSTWPWCVTLFIHCWIQLADTWLYIHIYI